MNIAEKLEETKFKHERLASDEEHAHEHHHVTPFWPMLIVFVVLCLLTVVTVLTAKFIDLPGTGNLLLALFIASFKACLVGAWFMHLKYDNKMYLAIVTATMFAVVLFLGFTMFDLGSRHLSDPVQAREIVRGGTDQVVQTARENAIAAGHGHDEDSHDHDETLRHGHEEEFIPGPDGLLEEVDENPNHHDG